MSVWYQMAMRSLPSSEPELGTLIGAAIKAMRLDVSWTEREFAARLRTNQAAVHRLEAGRQRHIDSQLATAALRLLGIRVSVDSNTPGRAGRREQRDAIHARCVGYVTRQLTQRGWEVRSEVEIGEDRYRGWIDVLGYRSSDGAILVIEVKTQIDDFGRVLRSLGCYARSSRDAARSLGWRPRIVVPALIALASVETDSRLAANVDLIRNELPGDADSLAAWVDDPATKAPKPSVALIDPISRRRAWLWRTRADGRRRPAAYADYRAAAAAMR